MISSRIRRVQSFLPGVAAGISNFTGSALTPHVNRVRMISGDGYSRHDNRGELGLSGGIAPALLVGKHDNKSRTVSLPTVSGGAITRSTPASLGACPSGARTFTTSSLLQSMRTKYLMGIKKDYGSEYDNLTVPTQKLLDALRDMQSWRQLTPATAKASDYRDSLRAISLLAGPDGGISKPQLQLKEIESVLSDEYGVTWRLIQDIIEHDLVPEIEALDEEFRMAVRINRVHGFGKVRALAFAKAGVRRLDDLLDAKDKELGRKVSDAQKLAIRYHREMEIMIPRAEVDEFNALIKSALRKADPTLNFAIMGSYRRGEVVSSDIDMVVWHDSFKAREKEEKRSKGITPGGLMDRVMQALFDAGLLEEDKLFSAGDKKVLALTRLPSPSSAHQASAASPVHRQIDIRLCPLESLPYMLLGNTGDDRLMKTLRYKALSKGWVLNEYAMGERMEDQTSTWVKEGSEIRVKGEEEIFKLLGVPYLEPTQRSYHRYKHIPGVTYT